MEPIRPDDDELRAERPVGAPEKKAPAQKKPAGSRGRGGKPKPPKAAKGGRNDNGGGSGRSSLAVLWLLVIAVAVALVAGGIRRISGFRCLKGSWRMRITGRGRVSWRWRGLRGSFGNGESLQQSRASLAEQVEAQKKQLDAADSEIRKLWVIANERNKSS